jgi:hypothetical protein
VELKIQRFGQPLGLWQLELDSQLLPEVGEQFISRRTSIQCAQQLFLVKYTQHIFFQWEHIQRIFFPEEHIQWLLFLREFVQHIFPK